MWPNQAVASCNTKGCCGMFGTSEKNLPIIVLPEEIQAVINRTGQLGDAGRMNVHVMVDLHWMTCC